MLGCEVVVSDHLHDAYASFDVVHLLNINNPFETYLRIRRIHTLPRRPAVVLTPLHHRTEWILPYYRACLGVDLGEAQDQGAMRFNALITGKDCLRYGILATRRPTLLARLPWLIASTFRQKRYIVNHIDALLVHTGLEAKSVQQDFRTRETPSVDVSLGWRQPNIGPRPPTLPRQYILSVARVEPLKNQLALIEAVRPLGTPLVLVGQINQHHRRYAQLFRDTIARSQHVTHMPFLEHGKLAALYAGAALHINASWFEVFPLTNVEAAAAGCPVVTTRNSYEKAAYGDEVEYVDPTSVHSIREAIVKTGMQGKHGRPENVLRHIPSWSGAAQLLVSAYKLAQETVNRGDAIPSCL